MSTTTLPRRAAGMTRGKLTVLSGPDQGLEREFEGRLRIGSRAYADLVLSDPAVSGVHCELITGEALRVRDLSSKNGTLIGSVRIIEAVLTPGEVLTLGSTRVQVAPAGDSADVAPAGDFTLHGLVGRSAPMRALLARIEAIAATESTVLLQGETGTGKERVAEALHLSSARAQGPLTTVDCGAMPSTLIEAELFGYERGAFTGADHAFAGAFERAAGGTVFLDEIGELPLALQPKLLRVLESREVRRLGDTKMIPVDVRVIAATNRDLPLEVSAGRFREDLFYRLAVIRLTVPPLRERVARSAAAHHAACASASASTRRRSSPPTACKRSPRTRGRATCASCATRSSAPPGSPSRRRSIRGRRRPAPPSHSTSTRPSTSARSSSTSSTKSATSPACSTSAAATSPRWRAARGSSA